MARYALIKANELADLSNEDKKKIIKSFKECKYKNIITKMVSNIAKDEISYFLTSYIAFNILKAEEIPEEEISFENLNFIDLIEDIYVYVKYHIDNEHINFFNFFIFDKIHDLDSLDDALNKDVGDGEYALQKYDVEVCTLWGYVSLDNEGIERMHRCRKQFVSFEPFFEMKFKNVQVDVATENHNLYAVIYEEQSQYICRCDRTIKEKIEITGRINSIDQLIVNVKKIIKRYIKMQGE